MNLLLSLLALINLTCPISLQLGRKTYYLNLNAYRNWHYQVSNKLKQLFKEAMRSQLENLSPINSPISITYTLYVPSARKCDLRNYTTVVDKFLCDALQEYLIIPDDNYTVIKSVSDIFGGIDRNNPRIEVNICTL